MSQKAQLIAAAFCRLFHTVFVATAITKIVAIYYEIVENFSIYDVKYLTCNAYRECIEYNLNQSSTTQLNQHKSAFGRIMIPIQHNTSKERKIKWTIEFSLLKNVPNAYFIGFTNHTSFVHCGPHRCAALIEEISAYFGYGFCFYRQIWCEKYFRVKGHYDDATRYDHIQNEVEVSEDPEKQFDGTIDDELQFGEVVFEIIFNGDWIGADIKIYKHPNSSVDGHMAYQDCQWSRLHASTKNSCKYWFLALSIPVGASGQILSVEIDNDIAFDLR